MKFIWFTPLCAVLAFAAGCAAEINYSEYISENRYALYTYSDDNIEIKLYGTTKEMPYIADGICGKKSDLTEIFVKTGENCENVSVSSQAFEGGDMSYLSSRGVWYISLGGKVEGSSITVDIAFDEQTESYTLANVLAEGVMDGASALDCVREHASALFEGLTENGIFNGEIFVRLLYNGDCYYYVGICDRQGNISAFLVDGHTGRIIAQREHSA